MTEITPTPAEVIEVALSGSGGAVKSLADIRIDKLEKRLADLENVNAKLAQDNIDLRQANAEMYAFIQSKAAEPAPAPQAQPVVPAQPAAPAPVPVAAEVQVPPAQPSQQDRENAILEDALTRLGYRKAQPKDDGM